MVEIGFDIEDLLTVELIYLNHTIALYRFVFYEYYLSIYICELFVMEGLVYMVYI